MRRTIYKTRVTLIHPTPVGCCCCNAAESPVGFVNVLFFYLIIFSNKGCFEILKSGLKTYIALPRNKYSTHKQDTIVYIHLNFAESMRSGYSE